MMTFERQSGDMDTNRPHKTVLITGAWDLFHIGHLNLLRIAANLGDFLIVTVTTDASIRKYKGKEPLFCFHDRIAIMSSLRMVDAVIPLNECEDLLAIVKTFGVDIVVTDETYSLGVSAYGQREPELIKSLESKGVTYVIVPRTPGISASSLKESFK